VLALEPIAGVRVVAQAGALDQASWFGEAEITVVRIAPDEAFAIGAKGADVDDPDAIVEPEPGFSVASLNRAGLESVLAHVEFGLPAERPAVVQGKVAGVPAKLLLREDSTLLIVQTAYAHDLEARLR
jgi:hypothetical protein